MAANPNPEPFERKQSVTEVRQGQDQPEITPFPRSNEPASLHREMVVQDIVSERYQRVNRVSQIIWLLLGIVDGLIGLRVLLKLIAANPQNDFASFVYNISDLFVLPFRGITGTPISEAGNALEIGSLIAMLVYLMVAWVVVRIIWIAFARPSARSVTIEDRNRM